MPYRRRGSFGQRRALSLRPVDSMKNCVYGESGTNASGIQKIIAIAKDNPVTTVQEEVERGCTIKSIWISLDICGLAATGVLQTTTVYLFKNPGANLTPPVPRTEGTSNEKKFVVKTWNYMTMRNQDGNPPYHWEGWVRLPKRYHRMGTDDFWSIQAATTTSTGHLSVQAIYKWFK